MGVSHRGDTDNVDGATAIAGNLNFVQGSSGSAVVGVFLSGNINVGTSTDSVANLTIRCCNINSVQVVNSSSNGIIVNQCYLRSPSKFGYTNAHISNNILHSIGHITGGTINHNVIVSNGGYGVGPVDRYGTHYCAYALGGVTSSGITNNFLLNPSNIHDGGGCYIYNNCTGTGSWGENPVKLDEGTTWDDVFKANKGVSIISEYKLIGKWGKGAATDGTDLGIYGGTSFNDDALAPIPRIVSKKVAEQTDGAGRLKIEVTVKAQ